MCATVADDVSYEQGDRVAILRMHGLTGEIQIIPATVLGVIDEYQVMLRFAGGEELAYPISDLTSMPEGDAES
ncbi:MAG: hypothetical protein QOJ63_2321 [Solirubrobacteraceae bacterium]|nr:hypothetical protein [Solirubrobacteraceae bacterium]